MNNEGDSPTLQLHYTGALKQVSSQSLASNAPARVISEKDDNQTIITEAWPPGDSEHHVGGSGQYPAAILPRRGQQEGRHSWSV